MNNLLSGLRLLQGLSLLLITACTTSDPIDDQPIIPVNEVVEKGWLVYFDRKENGAFQVYQYDGLNESKLTSDVNYDFWGVKFHPATGQFLCFRSPKGTGNQAFDRTALVVFNGDGTNQRVVVENGQYDWKMMRQASWSPDGSTILLNVFCTDPTISDQVERWRIAHIRADGTNPALLSKLQQDIFDPIWSPDGEKLAYLRHSDPSNESNFDAVELYVADFKTDSPALTNEDRLTNDTLYNFAPAWSPDGQWVAFTACSYANLGFNTDLYKCQANGENLTIVLDDNKVNSMPSWTPDGRRLFFQVAGLWENPFGVYSCDAVAGGDKKQVLSTSGIERHNVSVK